jgi:5-methylcytosine-specific restriction enzyme A
MGSGIVVKEPSLGEHFTDSTKEVLYVTVKVDVLLNPRNQAILTLEQLQQDILAEQHWTPRSSGISVKPELVSELETVWRDFLASSK